VTIVVTPWDGKPIDKPGVFSGVSMSAYHGANLCVGPSISSSGLRKIFTGSPMDYWIRSVYNSKALPQEDSRAFVVGRAAHHLCLGEADFKKFFVVRPEEYPDQKTGELKKWTRAAQFCKNWEAEASQLGLDILTPAELETIKGLAGIQPWQDGLEDSGLLNNAVVRAGALHGLIEHTIVAQDKETGVWLKARPDVIPTDSTEAGDFKTTLSVEAYKLTRTLDDFRYDMQAEIVSRCLDQAADFRLTNFALIFACKGEPHEVAVRELKQCDLESSHEDNDIAIRTFALCMETGRWPGIGGGEEDARYLERSDRNRERAADRRAQLHRYVFGH
jgi:hypothetical protein